MPFLALISEHDLSRLSQRRIVLNGFLKTEEFYLYNCIHLLYAVLSRTRDKTACIFPGIILDGRI